MKQDNKHYESDMPIAIIFCIVAVLATIAGIIPTVGQKSSLFDLSNWVGPTAKSLIENGTLESMPGMFGARMPLASMFIAGSYFLLGDTIVWVSIVKAMLVCAFLCLTIKFFIGKIKPTGRQAWIFLLILIIPLICTATIANIVNLQVEEGYAFIPFTAICALLFAPHTPDEPNTTKTNGIVFGLLLSLLFLSKSSFLPVCAAMLLGYQAVMQNWRLSALACSILAVTMALWAAYQWQTSGRFTVGTSVDGVNFYKGNNPQFLHRYPPAPGTTLDQYDEEIFKQFPAKGEWERNDIMMSAGLKHIKENPRDTALSVWKKIYHSSISLTKIGSSSPSGLQAHVEKIGLIITRALMLAAMIIGVSCIWHGGKKRTQSFVFFAVIGATMLPYIAGFAYTRHVGILIFPCALFIASTMFDASKRKI